MTEINNLYLDSLLWGLVQRAYDYYYPAGRCFELMYRSGCRRVEAIKFDKWDVVDSETIRLTPVKHNSYRYFSSDEVPTWFFDAVQDGIDPLVGFREGKVNYYIQKLEIQKLYNENKSLESHAFRHNWAKKQYYAGQSISDIRISMGESSNSVISNYINNPIYISAGVMLTSVFTSTDAMMYAGTGFFELTVDSGCLILFNYADNSDPIYFDSRITNLFEIPQHSFLNPFSGGVDKDLTIIISNPNLVTNMAIRNLRTINTLPSLPQYFNSLVSFYARDIYAVNATNFYSVSPVLYFYYTENLNSNTTLTSNLYIPLSNFQNTITRFEVRRDYYKNNMVNANFDKVSTLTELTYLTLDYWIVADITINFTPLTKLEYFRTLGATFINKYIPLNLSNCTSITSLNVQESNLEEYTNIPNLINLEVLNLNFLSTLNTTFLSTMNLLVSLDTLSFYSSFSTIARINAFIDSFYVFIDTNANKTAGSTAFRNMSINLGGANAIPSGVYLAPAGFVLGVSNGTPANQMEKLYVLIVQYNHSVTYNS